MQSVVTQASGGSGGSLILLALPLLLLLFLFWSQRKRNREFQAVQASLNVGDEVMTTGGMMGRLVSIDGQIATLEIASGVRVRFDRRALTKPIAAVTESTQDSAGSDGASGRTDEADGTDSAERNGDR